MALEILYRMLYDYTTESYGRDSNRTQTAKMGSLGWSGESDFVQEISEVEVDFLTNIQPTTSPYSWDHRNFRIEVYGLRVKGEKEMVFTANDPVRISQQVT